eukprot:jgi/Botrbrau1/18854/Bobra.177_2s0016.1
MRRDKYIDISAILLIVSFAAGKGLDIQQINLPVNLHWDLKFKGCKERARLGWADAEKRGKTCSVYILDLNDMAPALGIPTCSLANFSAAADSAMLLMEPRSVAIPVPEPRDAKEAKMWPWVSKPHYFAQTGAPWLFMEGLRKSGHHTNDINKSDVVFVNDYCYMLWGIAQQHARIHYLSTNGYQADNKIINYLLTLWSAIQELPRYKKDAGRSFVFWLPHSNTFYDHLLWSGRMVEKYIHYNCYVFRNSLHFATGPAARWRCPNYHPERSLIVPASSFDVHPNPIANRTGSANRDVFMYFKATCLQKPVNESFTDEDVMKAKVYREISGTH